MFTALDNRSEKALDYIRRFLQTASRVDICAAYVTADGVQLIAEDLRRFLDQGGRFRLLISDDNSAEDVEYLKSNWLAFPNTEVRVYPSDQGLLHAKLYLFFHPGGVNILVGSSNLTYGGLLSNIEHNLAGIEHLSRSEKVL